MAEQHSFADPKLIIQGHRDIWNQSYLTSFPAQWDGYVGLQSKEGSEAIIPTQGAVDSKEHGIGAFTMYGAMTGPRVGFKDN